MTADEERQYEALTRGVGWVDFRHRSHLEITGADRAKFLHSFCTNDIKKLAVGQGCEAFVLDTKGMVQQHVQVYSGPDSLLVEGAEGAAAWLAKFLDGYRIREAVEFHDRSGTWNELLLSGAESESLLQRTLGIVLPTERLAHLRMESGGEAVSVRRTDYVRGGILLVASPAGISMLREQLTRAGATACEPGIAEILRVEAGTPLPGVDWTEKTLPQELNRDERTISFKKGCYLGQETVARLDAMGHVNRLLVGLRFLEPSVPATGLELLSNGQVVGRISSAVRSPRVDRVVALGFVRRGQHTPGTRLESSHGLVEVVSW